MNIITTSYNSDFYYMRPDTSLNRDRNDYFCPDHITEITVVPFIYTRIEKAGKSISEKFASRYYNGIGYGLNLSAASLITPGCPVSFTTANSLDNTTYISALYKPEEFPGTVFSNNCPFKTKDGQTDIPEMLNIIHRKLAFITRFSSVRTGDLLIVESTVPARVSPGCTAKLGEIEFTLK